VGTFSKTFYRDEKQHRFEQIIGNSPALEAVFEEVQRVAPTSSTVLIQGETDRKGSDRNGNSQYQPALRSSLC